MNKALDMSENHLQLHFDGTMVDAFVVSHPGHFGTNITYEEIPFDIPENWQWVRWGEIVNIVSARRVHQADWKKERIPFYRAREIAKVATDGFVDNDLFISR